MALVAVFPRGVGGALILNGRLYRGAKGMAPEPGHLAVESPGAPGPEGTHSHSADGLKTFDDECTCSTVSRKNYGHVDALATPSRIEGQLASLRPGEQMTLEKAAASPRAVFSDDQDQLVVSEEAKILRRAPGARAWLDTNHQRTQPGQLVLMLPESLATPAPQSSGTEYLEAAEREIDNAYSTGASDARGGEDEIRSPSAAMPTTGSATTALSPPPPPCSTPSPSMLAGWTDARHPTARRRYAASRPNTRQKQAAGWHPGSLTQQGDPLWHSCGL